MKDSSLELASHLKEVTAVIQAKANESGDREKGWMGQTDIS